MIEDPKERRRRARTLRLDGDQLDAARGGQPQARFPPGRRRG